MSMPQVWLDEEELGEFLGCDPISARHQAIQSNWHRRISADSVMRYHLPPHAALRYVLLNAEAQQGPPRDAVLFERALEEIAGLERKLAIAEEAIASMRRELDLVSENSTDLMVSALRQAADEMRRGIMAEEERQRRTAA